MSSEEHVAVRVHAARESHVICRLDLEVAVIEDGVLEDRRCRDPHDAMRARLVAADLRVRDDLVGRNMRQDAGSI